ncbi:Neurexin-1a [Dirofilaria immitis]
MKEIRCTKKRPILISWSDKPEKLLKVSFLQKRSSKVHYWPKHKFSHFALIKKFSSVLDCFSNILQILIAQNYVPGKPSVLKEAEPRSSDVLDCNFRICLFINFSNTASYSNDLDSVSEFTESFQMLTKNYNCPFTLLNLSCKARQSRKKYQKKWFISNSSIIKGASLSPQPLSPTVLSSSFLSSSMTVAIPSTECNRKTELAHCTANLVINYFWKFSEFNLSADTNHLKSSLWQYGYEYFNLLKLLFLLMILLTKESNAILLSGAPGSYARYPKWVHTFENQLSLDFRTKQNSGMLLYTDDGGVQGNFYSLTIADKKLQLDFRLGDESNYLSSERPVNTMRLNDVEVNDYRWHRLTLFQAWENVKLQLDDTILFKILNQHNFAFGDLKTNSDMFIGGVPKDTYLLGTMSSPLKRHTIPFIGEVKNLLYRLHPQGVTSPQLIESVGMRESDDDYCKPTSIAGKDDYFCRNGGICYSTNEGPNCDCSFTDFQGRRCEQNRFDSNLSFHGQELIGYDVSNNSAAIIRFRSENITLSFKTTQGRALLYIGGDRLNYVHITLDDGAVVATSKFDGTEKRLVRIFNDYPSGRYDDDRWHTVIVFRTLTLMILSVDGLKDEIRQYAPEINWLVNSFAYLGGKPKNKNIPEIEIENFRGCLKKIKYEADAHLINFITLANQGYGQSVIRSTGDLKFSCSKSAIYATDVFSFNNGQHYITLPKWNSVASGSLSFQLRTQELDGLILYHGSLPTAKTGHDYFAFELVDGHLFMIIDLGSGYIRLQTTAEKITDGAVWHSVTLERMGRTGTVIVDNIKTDFSTPGVSANLIIEEPIYLGAVPWPRNESDIIDFHVPYPIWTANLRKGYIGCLKGVRINGISPNIATFFQEQQKNIKEGITYGCADNMNHDFCALSPCKNFGRCENGYNSFRCDCSVSAMEGQLCDKEPEFVDFSMDDASSLLLPKSIESEAETIECKFRSDDERSVLFDTKSMKSPNHRILLLLIKGELELHLNFDDSHHTFNWGSNLNDDRIHSMRIKRRGEKLLLFLDGRWEHSYFLPSKIVLDIDEVAAGHSLHAISSSHFTTRANLTLGEKFRGQMLKMLFNDYDILKNAKRRSLIANPLSKTIEMRERYKIRNRKAKYSSVTFEKPNAYAMINDERLANIRNVYRISFKFRTLSSSSILLAFTTNSTYSRDSASLELYNGRIRYTYGFNSRIETVLSSTFPDGQVLNNFKWHSVLIHQKSLGGEHYLVVDNRSTTINNVQGHLVNLDAQLYIGNIPFDTSTFPNLKNVPGFRGCISSLRIGNEYLDILKDAMESSGIVKGCHGPHARCSSKACLNRGKCIQKWNSVRCDCSMTTYGGERCDSLGTTYIFDSSLSAIYYEYPQSIRPSTNRDEIAIGFRTRQATAVLLSVHCNVDGDFFTIFLKNGYLHVRYNLGSRDHNVVSMGNLLNDDRHHAIIIYRQETNLTLYIDDREPVYYSPHGGDIELVTLNMQWRITIGASFNLLHHRKRRKREQIYDSYNGFITGVNFNGLMILDMLAQGSQQVYRIGLPRLVHMSSRSSSFVEKDSFMNNIPEKGDYSAVNDWTATSEEGLIEAEGSGCVEFEEQEKCQIIDFDHTGLITPVLPIARITEEGVESSITLLNTSERTLTITVHPAKSTIASLKQSENLAEENHQAEVNGEFTESTHTFLSTIVITTTTTFVTTIATAHNSMTTIVDTTITSTFSLSQKHDIIHGIFAIPKTNSNRNTLTSVLLHFDLDDDDDDDGDVNDDRFTFFWPTMKSFRTQTASETKNLKTVSLGNQYAINTFPIHTFRWDDSITKGHFYSLTLQKRYGPKDDKYGNPILSKPDINPNCQGHLKSKGNYYNCLEIAAISTFSASLSPHVSQASAAPSLSDTVINKIVHISNAMSQQPNRNYFEDLWSDIVGQPDVIIDSSQNESRNKSARTTLPTITKTISNNLSTRPLTFTTLHSIRPTHQTVSLNKEATHRSDKSLSSATTKIASFLLNISTKSSLVIDSAEEGKKEIERPEAKNPGVIQPQHKSQRVLTAPTLSSTIKHRIRTTLVSHTLYAVRPTTPMGELITDTVKTPTTPTDFPRTALISIASLSVIIIIAIVVFCVFRCRQSGPSTDQYPMVCSGKQSGYAPIPAEVSPPMIREPPRQNIGPFFQNRVNQVDGYQPIKGAVIPNGNNLASNIKGIFSV